MSSYIKRQNAVSGKRAYATLKPRSSSSLTAKVAKVEQEVKKMERSHSTLLPTIRASSLAGFPPRALVRLKYFDQVNVNIPTANTAVDTQFRLNSIYDPLASGIGVYPAAYAAWTQFYQYYRVISTKYKIQFPNIAGEDNLLTVIPYNGNNTYNAQAKNAYVTEPRAKFKYSTGSSQIPSSRNFSGAISMRELTGQSIDEYKADDTNYAVVGGNPTKVVNMHCIIDATASSANNPLLVYLEFFVEFFGPKQLVA